MPLLSEVAEGVWHLPGLVPWLINVYLVRTPAGDVLIDASTRFHAGAILRALRGRRLAMVALTHAHPDHQGAAHEVCSRLGVPLACHVGDVDVMEGRTPMGHSKPVRFFARLLAGPPHPVAVRLRGGEAFGDWRVVHAPGHTPGHVILHRERDGVAIVGDVLRNAALRTGPGTLSETPHFFSVDPMLNRRSMRLVPGLSPLRLMLFGHGPPSTDVAGVEALVRKLGA
jgi:glyoxylase-like metal-dependent hydrolase (beta-lactamase superfamily II)